jgi:spore coat protein H
VGSASPARRRWRRAPARAARDACAVDVGRGAEPGTCLATAQALACAPTRWLAAVDDQPAALGGGEVGLCGGHDEGDVCSTYSGDTGTCARTTGPLICQVDGFDDADVSWVPDHAAAPFWPRKPEYFHATATFDGVVFTDVGLRYKGNNGLASALNEKRPLRIKVDEWEDTIPEITDQRLFGFQELSLSPHWIDYSILHQVVAAKMFRDAGVPAPLASFVEVELVVDGARTLLGVYALTEIPDNPQLERDFDDDHGNLYKPDGRGAHLLDFVEASFHKKNNEEAADFTDVQAFIDALHAPQADRSAWRAGLRATYDMDRFVRSYAVNQAMANWDTYGGLAHNYYYYADPASGALVYIPWDFDWGFDKTGFNDLSLDSFGGEWPLLQAVARDADFATRYREALADVHTEQFVSGKLTDEIDEFEALLRPAIQREDATLSGRENEFDAGVQAMRDHVLNQEAAIQQFLAGQPALAARAGAPLAPALRAAPPAEALAWRRAVSTGQ